MPLLVLAFLGLESSDAHRIESVRTGRDNPSHALVPPHFTLVFATNAITPQALVEHVQRETNEIPPFTFLAESSDIVWDAIGSLWLLRLVPEQGAEITEIHDALYCGILAPELRTDLPYAPHVTIIAAKDKQQCLAAQSELGTAPIAGAIEALDVVEYDGVHVTTIVRVGLG